MKQHYYELDLRIQRGKIFELALRRKLEIERIYKKTGTDFLIIIFFLKILLNMIININYFIIGTKLYNRIKVRIALTDKNIQNAVNKYNEIIKSFSYLNSNIQIIQNWKDVCDIEGEFWKTYLNEEMLPNVNSFIRKGINSMLILDRCNEELSELQLEIERVKIWGNQYINILESAEVEINMEMDIEIGFEKIRYKKGKLKWIINEKLNIKNQINEFEYLLNKKNIENIEDDNDNEYLYDNEIDKLDVDEFELNENDEI
jgi:hypothetical protein